MSTLVKREEFIVTLLSVGILLLSLAPWFWKATHVPAGKTFLPVHNSLSDYPFYTSIIKQGTEGESKVFNRFAIEPQTGGIVHLFYLAIGKTGSLFGLHDSHELYHLSRIFFGSLLVGVAYWFLRVLPLTKNERILALFCVLYSTSLPAFTPTGQVSWSMTWWTELDPMQRAMFLPHFLVGHSLALLSFGSVIRLQHTRKYWWFLFFCLFGWLAGFIHPPSLLILGMTLPVWFLGQRDIKSLICITLGLVFSATSLLFLRESLQVFPWNLSAQFERLSFAISPYEYLMALGPVVPLSILGAIGHYRKRETWLFLLWIWIPVVLLQYVPLMTSHSMAWIRDLAFSNLRLLQVTPWVPLGILAAQGFFVIKKYFGSIVFGLLLSIFLVLTFVGYPQAIKKEATSVYGDSRLMYPSGGSWEAMESLSTPADTKSVILALPLAGSVIPSFVNRTVYVGTAWYYSVDLDAKMSRVWKFYSGTNLICDNYKFLKENHITTIYYGYDEQNAGRAILSYPFLRPWKTYEDTSIFTFVDVPPVGCE